MDNEPGLDRGRSSWSDGGTGAWTDARSDDEGLARTADGADRRAPASPWLPATSRDVTAWEADDVEWYRSAPVMAASWEFAGASWSQVEAGN